MRDEIRPQVSKLINVVLYLALLMSVYGMVIIAIAIIAGSANFGGYVAAGSTAMFTGVLGCAIYSALKAISQANKPDAGDGR